jgi:hypothetical protein
LGVSLVLASSRAIGSDAFLFMYLEI